MVIRGTGWLKDRAARYWAGAGILLWGWCLLVAVGYRDLSRQQQRDQLLRSQGAYLIRLLENLARGCRAEIMTLASLERRLERRHREQSRELLAEDGSPGEISRRLARLEQSWERERRWRRQLIRTRAWRSLVGLGVACPEESLLAIFLAGNRPESCPPLSWRRDSVPRAAWREREALSREGSWEEGKTDRGRILRRFRRVAEFSGGSRVEMQAVFDWLPSGWWGVFPISSPGAWLFFGMLVLAGLLYGFRGLGLPPGTSRAKRPPGETTNLPEDRRRHDLAEKDLSLATEMLAQLLPEKLPQVAGYEWAAFYRPSREVGGDYYDFFWIDDRRLAVLIADVSGKGIPASLMMTMARSLIRMEARQGLSPRETLIRANRHICHDIKKGMFITSLYLVLEVDSRRLHLVSAGHNPLLLWRARTRSLNPVRPGGIALGLDGGTLFERTLREGVLHLEPGDRVVLYTDGVNESRNPQGEFFGEQRFFRFVGENSGTSANQFINLLATSLDEFRGSSPQRDDITVVIFGIPPGS